jgi:hypothetical protein
MSVGLNPPLWHDLFSAFGTICGALLGLFFVGLSLHVSHVRDDPVLAFRSRSYLQGLGAGIVVSVFVLIPGQATSLLGVELVVTYLVLVGLFLRPWLRMRGGRPHLGRLSRFWETLVTLSIALGLVAGANLIVGGGPGLFLVVPILVTTVCQASWGAWTVLLADTPVGISRTGEVKRDRKRG